MPLDEDLGFLPGGDKDVVPLLKQIERNTRLMGGSGKSGRGSPESFLSSPGFSPKAKREAREASAKSTPQAAARVSPQASSAARTTADAVAKGVSKGFQEALETTAARLSDVVQDAAKATAQAQKKANADLVRQQKKLTNGPRSTEGLQRYRENRKASFVSQERTMHFDWMKSLVSQVKGFVPKSGRGEDVKDAAGQLAAGGPVWGAFKELSAAAESAKESLDDFRKSSAKAGKQAKQGAVKGGSTPNGGALVRDGRGRYSSQNQGETRRHRELLTAVKSGRGGRTIVQNEGGGLLDDLDNAMDIWGHAKNSKWGKKAGGALGKVGRAGKGLLGKGLGLLGIGGIGAGALGVGGAVAGGTAAAGGVGMAGRLMGKLGPRAIPGIGTALAVGLAAVDGVQAWSDKGLHRQAFGLKDGEEATAGQKTASATAGVLDMGGLTSMALGAFGVDTDASKIAAGLYGAVTKLTGSVEENSKAQKEEPSWLSKIFGGGPILGKIFGGGGDSKTTTAAQVAKDSGTGPSVSPPALSSRLTEQFGRPAGGSSSSPFATITQGKSTALDAINSAAGATGVDPGTLAKIAKVESNLQTNAKAGTSSAGGLFQFTDDTWNATVAKHGAKHGIAPGASKFDAKANALMGAELFKETKGDLTKRLGREASEKDVYMGHFLGTSGAGRFLEGMQANPNADATTLASEKAVSANQSIFRTKDGRNRSAQEVYDLMGGKLDKAGNALLKDGSLQAMQDPAAAKGTPGGPTGNGALDAATLNMPVKTSQGIKTPAQMGIKTYSELQQKGGQAFSGGYNDPTTTALTAEIMQKTGASYLSAQNDSYHQTNAPGSGHTKGVKTDFSYAGLSDGGYKGKHAEISQHLASKYGMQEGQDFKIISDPHGTGKHIDFKLNESGRAKAEAVRQAQAQGQAQAQVAANATPASGQSQAATPAVENSKPDTAPAAQTAQAPKSFYDPNSKLSTHQQASLGSIQKRIDEANASGNTAAAQKWEAMKSAKEKDYGVTPQQQGQTPAQSAQQPSQQAAATDSPAQAQPAQATSKSASMQIVDKRIADARAAGNEAQARKWESFRDMKAGRPAQSQPKQPESAQDIKASTPPPPAPDNSGVEKAVNNLAQAQQQRNTEQERKTDEQSTPNIPTQFDDYTLQTWAHDRA